MALSITEVNTVQSKYFDKTMSQIQYEDCPLWVKLYKNNKVKIRGGSQLQWPIRYTSFGKADAVDPEAQVSFEAKSTRTGAVLDWSYYVVPQLITWAERVKNTGKPQIVNLLEDKATEMVQDMNNRFATDLHATNGNGLGIISLPVIIDSADTYAGIAVADAANWAATEDGSTTVLELYGSGSVSYMCNAATFGKKMPNFHVTTRDLASKAESLIEPQKRYRDSDFGDAGFLNVAFHGGTIVGDVYCTAASWYGLCLDEWEIWVHPDWDMVMTPWKELFQAGYPNAMGRTRSWAGNIVCRNRRVNFKYTALDYTL